MTSVLGKRKSRSKEPLVSEEDAQEIFRRHFEAQFAPLEETKKPETRKAKLTVEEEDEEEEEDDDEAWKGISDDDEGDGEGHEGTEHTVEVVDHTGSKPRDQPASMSKRELKAFMSSRPPSTDARTPASKAQQQHNDPPSDPENEATLRAQDIALQRLLTESHLLSSLTHNANHHASTHSSQKPFAAGKLRNRTTDLRIQGLLSGGGGGGSGGPSGSGPGPKAESIYEQKKMPMNMRKRINATRDAREEKRRRQAKENGIVLEKEKKKGADAKRAKRERAIDGPEVGRMRGAELRLTDKDVQKIQGPGSGGFRGDKSSKKMRR